MKKSKRLLLIVFAIALTASLAVALSACSNATTQGQLANVWRNSETYVYNVTDESGGADAVKTGIYTVSINRREKEDVEIGGGITLTNVKLGYLVTGDLDIDGTRYITRCYYEIINGNNFLVPRATFRSQTVGGVETLQMSGTYEGNTLTYTLTKDGNKTSGKLEGKSPLYDNNQFHQVLRGATTLSKNFTFGFNVPVVSNEITIASLTARCTSTVRIQNGWTASFTDKEGAKPYSENGIECYEVSISRTTQVDGASQTLYYATGDVVDPSGWHIVKPLIKIVEPGKHGNVTYNLKSVSLGQQN